MMMMIIKKRKKEKKPPRSQDAAPYMYEAKPNMSILPACLLTLYAAVQSSHSTDAE